MAVFSSAIDFAHSVCLAVITLIRQAENFPLEIAENRIEKTI